MSAPPFSPPTTGPLPPNLSGAKGLVILGLFVLAVIFLRQQASTKVSIDVLVSSLAWKNAGAAGPWTKFAITANDSSQFTWPAAHIESNSTGGNFADTQKIILHPVRPFTPITVHELAFPLHSKVRLTQDAPTGLQMEVESLPPFDSASVLRWQVAFQQRLYKNPDTHILDTLGSSDDNEEFPRELKLEKRLKQSDSYLLTFTQPHAWKSPTGLLATDLEFIESDLLKTAAVSSVLSGRVKLLETNDDTIHLSERDVLKVRFDSPVELYLKGTSAGIMLHVDGNAYQLICGPKIMEKDNNRMPLVIKSYYDKAPYIGAALTLLVALLTWISPNPFKSKR